MKFSITGTRNKLAVENNLPFIASMLEKHIMEIKPIEIYFGGALGIDMAALLICKETSQSTNSAHYCTTKYTWCANRQPCI